MRTTFTTAGRTAAAQSVATTALASRPVLQRKCACGGSGGKQDEECAGCKHESLTVRRRALSGAAPAAGSAVPGIVHEVLRRSGMPLDQATRTDMERRFGHDFGHVRVHADEMAARSARSVNALAYTVGRDVVFGAGRYAPATTDGQQLLAHELTHVVQQRNAVPSGRIELGDSDSAYEREADAFAARPDRAGMPAASTALVVARDEPPAPATEDCSEDQTRMLNSHLDDARAWVNAATPKIVSYAYFYANPRVTAVPADPSAHDVTRNALRDNFHTTSDGVLTIRDNFQELQSALNSSITFECEEEGCESYAYVRGAIAAVRRLGDIHVCPPWFSCRDYYSRVRTLIHERAHQYPGVGHPAYEWDPAYETLEVDDAIDNADSYAITARQIYHGGAHGRGPQNC
jgi:hypothetical protein